jgi:hypothetical protein
MVVLLGGTTSCIFCTKYDDINLIKKDTSKFSEILTMNTEVVSHCVFNGCPSDRGWMKGTFIHRPNHLTKISTKSTKNEELIFFLQCP